MLAVGGWDWDLVKSKVGLDWAVVPNEGVFVASGEKNPMLIGLRRELVCELN